MWTRLQRCTLAIAVVCCTSIVSIGANGNGNQGGCFWQTNIPCVIDCMSGESSGLPDIIDYYVESTNNQCIHGISLIIGSSVTFPKRWTLTKGWLPTSRAKITSLHVQCRNFDEIEADAFATEAFADLQVLTLDTIFENVFSKHSLRGMPSLRHLSLTSFAAKALRAEMLDGVKENLTEFNLFELNDKERPLILDPVLGFTRLPSLKNVNIVRNLNDTLGPLTFLGLINITHLDLANCQITSLGDGVFETIAATLREINLQFNLLQTLPMGLLDSLILRPYIRVLLQNNRWHCDCDLCYTKWAMTNGLNLGLHGATCRTPEYFRNELITDTRLCPNIWCDQYSLCDRPDNAHMPFCVMETPTSPAPWNEPTGDGWDEQPVMHQCFDANYNPLGVVAVKPRKYYVQLRPVDLVTVSVQVSSDWSNLTGETYLVWFESNHSYTPGEDENAASADGCAKGCQQVHFDDMQQASLSIGIKVNLAYIFCIMHGPGGNASPLDCMPYVSWRNDFQDTPWLYSADMPVSISMMVLAVVSSLLLGFCLGYITMRCFPTLLTGGRNVIVVKKEPERPVSVPYSYGGSSGTECDMRRGSVSSTQSYAMPTINLSRFEIVRRKLEKQENQYGLENMPYAVAPRAPSLQSGDLVPVMPDRKASVAVDKRESLMSAKTTGPDMNENIYTVI